MNKVCKMGGNFFLVIALYDITASNRMNKLISGLNLMVLFGSLLACLRKLGQAFNALRHSSFIVGLIRSESGIIAGPF